MSDSTNVQAAAMFGMLAVIFLVVFVLYAIPAIVVYWKLYKKAGQPGWAVIIPVYSSIIMAKIGKKSVWLGVAAGVLGIASASFDDPLKQLFNLASLVLMVILIVAMSKQYDQGVGFWLLSIFLPIVAVFMVNKVNYTGGTAELSSNSTPPAAPVQPTAPQV